MSRTIIKPRRDTTANWEVNNPILADGELAIEKVTGSNLVKLKIGDGVTAWKDLPVSADFPSIATSEKNAGDSATAAATSATQATNVAKLCWTPGAAYTAGDVILAAPSLSKSLRIICKTGGTSGASEPTWTAANTTVTDNGVTWMVKNAGDIKPLINVSSVRTLNDYELESMVVLSGSTTYTLTLPVPTTAGHTLLIRNAGSVAMTLSTPSGLFDGPNGTSLNTMSLPSNVVCGLLSNGTNWVVERYQVNWNNYYTKNEVNELLNDTGLTVVDGKLNITYTE